MLFDFFGRYFFGFCKLLRIFLHLFISKGTNAVLSYSGNKYWADKHITLYSPVSFHPVQFAFLVDNDNRTVSVFKILNESLYCSLLPIQCIRNFRFIRRAVRLNNKNSDQIIRHMSSRFVKVNLPKSDTVAEKRAFICCNDIADREGMPAVQTMPFCIEKAVNVF